VIHVYAFAEDLRGLPDVDGLDGARLEQLSCDGVAAVYSRRVSSARPSRDEALVHGTVVGALERRAATVVPVRYGQVLQNEQALAEAVRSKGEAIRTTFARVRDCVEIAVRVWGAPTRVEAADGAGYMHGRREAELQRRAVVDQLHERVSSAARDARIRYGALGGEELFVAAYLIPAARLTEVTREVESFGSDHRDLTVVCTGPWPPFSFAEDASG
jgi:hypothetical protein